MDRAADRQVQEVWAQAMIHALALLSLIYLVGKFRYKLERYENGLRSTKYGFFMAFNLLEKDNRCWGYEHIHYDGDFYSLSFYLFQFVYITNPHCYLTEAEIRANIEAWYVAHPEHRPKE
jgi:hypothetical protein